MYFIVIGVVIILLHFLGIGPMAAWTWNLTGDLWKFCVPFVLAAIWWAWADGTGLTKRREMEKMEERKRGRREKNLVALGMDKMARRAKKAGK
jgi:small Trp-rich protein